jgi:hypothetical protein
MREFLIKIQSYDPCATGWIFITVSLSAVAFAAGAAIDAIWPFVALAPVPLILARNPGRGWIVALASSLGYVTGAITRLAGELTTLADALLHTNELGIALVSMYVLFVLITRYANSALAGWFAMCSFPIVFALCMSIAKLRPPPVSRIESAPAGEGIARVTKLSYSSNDQLDCARCIVVRFDSLSFAAVDCSVNEGSARSAWVESLCSRRAPPLPDPKGGVTAQASAPLRDAAAHSETFQIR